VFLITYFWECYSVFFEDCEDTMGNQKSIFTSYVMHWDRGSAGMLGELTKQQKHAYGKRERCLHTHIGAGVMGFLLHSMERVCMELWHNYVELFIQISSFIILRTFCVFLSKMGLTGRFINIKKDYRLFNYHISLAFALFSNRTS